MRELLQYALLYIKEHKGTYITGFLIVLVTTALQLPVPFLFKKMIDSAVYSHKINLFALFGVLILSITLLREGGRLLSNIMLEKKVIEIVKRIKTKLMLSFLKRALYPHEKEGYVVSRVYDEPDDLREIFFDAYIILIKSVLLFVFGIFALIYISARLTLLLLAFLPLYVFITGKMKNILNTYMRPVMENDAVAREELTSIAGMTLEYRLYDKAGFFYRKVEDPINRVFNSYYRYIKRAFYYDVVLNVVSDLIPISIIFLGVYEIYMGRLTIGGLFAFTSMQNYLISPIQSIMNLRVGLVKSYVAYRRIKEFSEYRQDMSKGKSLAQKDYLINISSVSVKIKDRTILKDVNLQVNEKDRILVYGENGSGKTMLLRVICNFAGSFEGEVNYTIEPQKDISALIDIPRLFKGTLSENIVFDSDYDVERLNNVIKLVKLDTNKFSLDYPIEANASNLSMGERQKIALARTLYKRAKVYLLDEPIEHIPYREAMEIFRNILNFLDTSAIITVAHKLDDLKIFHNRLIRMQDGTIKETFITAGGGYVSS